MTNSLSIVILSYNRFDDLKKNLEYLFVNRGDILQVVVVDNSSSDGSVDYLKSLRVRWPELDVVYNEINCGVAKGRNSGYRICKGDFILNIDDDSFMEVGEIEKFLFWFSGESKIGLSSPMIKHPKTGDVQNQSERKISPVGNFHGACYLFKRGLLKEIGYLDEECWFGGEELDYSIRIKKYGLEVYVNHEMVCYHNSMIRGAGDMERRIVNWCYGYARLNAKYFYFWTALIQTIRYTFKRVLGQLIRGKFNASIKILIYAVKGFFVGCRGKDLAPELVQKIYSNKNNRPDIGNVRIISTMVSKCWKK